MRILLTGGQGQLAQAIINYYNNYHYNNELKLFFCDKKSLDITSKASIQDNIQQYCPDIIINTAAYTAVDKAESSPEQAYLVNAIGCQYLAESCAENHIFLIHFSTDYVFDGEKKHAYGETDTPNPVNIYGNTKLEGERWIQALCQHYWIFRVSWVFSEYGHNFVKTMVKLMQERETLSIVNDQTGCPTYAGDIATMLFSVLPNQDKPAGIYHYTGLPPVTWFEFAEIIYNKLKLMHPQQWLIKTNQLLPVSTALYPTPAKRGKNSVLNTDLFQAVFKQNVIDWQIGLEKTLKNTIIKPCIDRH